MEEMGCIASQESREGYIRIESNIYNFLLAPDETLAFEAKITTSIFQLHPIFLTTWLPRVACRIE